MHTICTNNNIDNQMKIVKTKYSCNCKLFISNKENKEKVVVSEISIHTVRNCDSRKTRPPPTWDLYFLNYCSNDRDYI